VKAIQAIMEKSELEIKEDNQILIPEELEH
jgi:hypothetical protein